MDAAPRARRRYKKSDHESDARYSISLFVLNK